MMGCRQADPVPECSRFGFCLLPEVEVEWDLTPAAIFWVEARKSELFWQSPPLNIFGYLQMNYFPPQSQFFFRPDGLLKTWFSWPGVSLAVRD